MMRGPVVDNEDRVLVAGRPDFERCDNKVLTAKYSLLTFLPIVSLCLFIPFSFYSKTHVVSSMDTEE
jgi:hypothetical protein